MRASVLWRVFAACTSLTKRVVDVVQMLLSIRSLCIAEGATAIENTEATKIDAGPNIKAGVARDQNRQAPAHVCDSVLDPRAVPGAGGKLKTLSKLTPDAEKYLHAIELEAVTAQAASGHQDSEGSAFSSTCT